MDGWAIPPRVADFLAGAGVAVDRATPAEIQVAIGPRQPSCARGVELSLDRWRAAFLRLRR